MKAAFLANSGQLFAASGQDLMGISLMADIPDQVIKWRVIHIVKRHSQFDRTKTRGKVATGMAD
ncbi:Uncharacterised protein [Grimontia hollisae]|uniref:Uncharacterized protein n=1 Tax=Grimontia hollisae TaxID=673 RepID=A0A377J8M4_GRIHO|nr:Uncharacterised protein [Grimontia hollisae]